MIKATSTTPDPSVVRHAVCKNCGQACSYVPKDVRNGGDEHGNFWYVACPSCGKKIEVKSPYVREKRPVAHPVPEGSLHAGFGALLTLCAAYPIPGAVLDTPAEDLHAQAELLARRGRWAVGFRVSWSLALPDAPTTHLGLEIVEAKVSVHWSKAAGALDELHALLPALQALAGLAQACDALVPTIFATPPETTDVG